MPVTLVLYITFNITKIGYIVVKENGGCAVRLAGVAAVRNEGRLKKNLKSDIDQQSICKPLTYYASLSQPHQSYHHHDRSHRLCLNIHLGSPWKNHGSLDDLK